MTSSRSRRLGFPSLVAALVWASPASAQASAPPHDGGTPSTQHAPDGLARDATLLDEISGSLVVGPGWFDPGDLGDRLRAHGFEDVDTQTVLLGLSGRIIFDNAIALGAAGAILGRGAVDGSGEYDATLGYNTLRAEAGYAVLHSDTWLLLPKLTLGVYSATLALNDDRDATFDELLEQPGTTTHLSSRGVLMGALLDFEFRFAPGRTDNTARGFFGVGIEGGYFYSLPMSSWRLDSEASVKDGPDAPLTGGFVGVTLGGGVLDL